MFAFIAGIPSRVKHLLSRFKKHFTKPQYKNFCRTILGLIAAGEGEHDVKSINELFIDRKDQSSLNRFITASPWSTHRLEARRLTLARQSLLPTEARAGGLNNSCVYLGELSPSF